MKAPPPTLVALSPGSLDRSAGGVAASAAFVRAAHAAVRGGLAGLILREPGLEDGAFLALALELREVLADGWFGVHDRVHLAQPVGADGVHLGGRSLPVLAARRVVGDGLCVGVSTHAADPEVRWEGADVAFHAPVFAPRSKASTAAPLGPEGLAAFTRACALPVWGLGGIEESNVPSLASSGVRGVAAIGALWGIEASSPAAAPRAPFEIEGVEARARGLARAAEAAFGEVVR